MLDPQTIIEFRELLSQEKFKLYHEFLRHMNLPERTWSRGLWEALHRAKNALADWDEQSLERLMSPKQQVSDVMRDCVDPFLQSLKE